MLERAIYFALTAVQGVTPDMLGRGTPCGEWNLEMLLLHLRDSLAALYDGVCLGRVAMNPEPLVPEEDPVSAVRVRAVRLLRKSLCPGRVEIGDRSMDRELMAAAGAIEVAVHGWDIAQASGRRAPVPPALADELLMIVPLLAPEPQDRWPLFAEPVEPGVDAGAGDRLVAFLGRRPLG
ncbi:TIGR03086 family metal-binding protein [Actinomadura pelletieri]|uniref:TIGR03086 family metal-binding protein n=1 Tax=Actinomadura pelletieri TaxID=111805 RepID=UPI001476C4CC|nr:TIGR03086 family metal-binding protein [Actinomadura pelletieri]